MSIVLLHPTWFTQLPDLYRSSLTKVCGFGYTWPSYHCWEYFIHQSSWASPSSAWNCWSTIEFYSIMQRFSCESNMIKILTLSVYRTCIWQSWVSMYKTKTWGLQPPIVSLHHLTSPYYSFGWLKFNTRPWYTSSNRIVPIPVVSSLWTTMYCIPNVTYFHPLCKAVMMSYFYGMEQDV
jgi:hypothetical protein